MFLGSPVRAGGHTRRASDCCLPVLFVVGRGGVGGDGGRQTARHFTADRCVFAPYVGSAYNKHSELITQFEDTRMSQEFVSTNSR